jgi:hypothetical protein
MLLYYILVVQILVYTVEEEKKPISINGSVFFFNFHQYSCHIITFTLRPFLLLEMWRRAMFALYIAILHMNH